MNFLAGTFRDLANDSTWPWTSDSQFGIRSVKGSIIARCAVATSIPSQLPNDFQAKATTNFIAQSPINMARLAVMVIEQKYKWTPEEVKNFEQIKRDYANVKERVEKAEAKG